MVNGIRIYIEGGGDGRNTKLVFRQGFSIFLNGLKSIARNKRIGWKIIACGTRNKTYDNFLIALKSHPDTFNVLLVDSESTVENSPCKHLKNQDDWNLKKSLNENCHLMVQLMESWFLADIDTLKNFFGKGFNINSLPKNPSVEKISKKDVENSLKAATRKSIKGEYQEINHGSKILELLDVSLVRKAAPHCERLFNTLKEKMETSS